MACITQTGREKVPAHLARILSSSGFARNSRLSAFLRFIVEQELGNRGSELKESLIGLEVFGRKPGYDPRQDSVVRTEAAKLRARLAEYYLSEGGSDSVIIELPKGGYTPVFRLREAAVLPVPAPAVPKPPETGHAPEKNLRRTIVVVAAVVIVVGTALGARQWQLGRSAPLTIAVLPLKNLSAEPANDLFADGLTGEIIRDLSMMEGLTVRSETSSFAFKGRPRHIREAGAQLAAEYIVDGSVQRAGGQLRITAQLVRVRDDLPLWSGKFDRKIADVFAVQDEISRGIVNSLRLKLGAGRRRYETNVEAYDLYLRARALILQHGLQGYSESIEPFEQAIAKDRSFAPAYAGLSVARAARSGQFKFNMADEAAKARVAAETAIQLDPLLAEAHEALGRVYAREGRRREAEKSMRRAIELDRGRSTTYNSYAFFCLLPYGRNEEAVQQLRLAEQADPSSPLIQFSLAYALTNAGKYEEAEKYLRKLPADYPDRRAYLARVRLFRGKAAEVIQELEPEYRRGVPSASYIRGALGCAYAAAGRRAEAEQVAHESAFNPFNPAAIFACLGDKDRTFEVLAVAIEAGAFRFGRAIHSPEYASLHGDARLAALCKRAGLRE
jgi:TolB-like protein/Tfp pilus assembly protein PilF